MPKISGNGQSIILNSYQLDLIKSRMEYKYQVICDILYFTGARVSECLSIRRCDVLSGYIVIRVADDYTASFSGATTSTITSVSGYNIYSVTAAPPTSTVTFTS